MFSKIKKAFNSVQGHLTFLLNGIGTRLIGFRTFIASVIGKRVVITTMAFAIISIPCLIEGQQIVFMDKSTESDLCSFMVEDVRIENIENGVIVLSGKIIETVFVKESLGFDKSGSKFSSSDIEVLPSIDPNRSKITDNASDNCATKGNYSNIPERHFFRHYSLLGLSPSVSGGLCVLIPLVIIAILLFIDDQLWRSYGGLMGFLKWHFTRLLKL